MTWLSESLTHHYINDKGVRRWGDAFIIWRITVSDIEKKVLVQDRQARFHEKDHRTSVAAALMALVRRACVRVRGPPFRRAGKTQPQHRFIR